MSDPFYINERPATQQEMMLLLELINQTARTKKCPTIPYTTQTISAETIYSRLDSDKNGEVNFRDRDGTELLISSDLGSGIFEDVAEILAKHGMKAKRTEQLEVNCLVDAFCIDLKQPYLRNDQPVICYDDIVRFIHIETAQALSFHQKEPEMELQATQNREDLTQWDIYISVLPNSKLAENFGSIAVKIGTLSSGETVIPPQFTSAVSNEGAPYLVVESKTRITDQTIDRLHVSFEEIKARIRDTYHYGTREKLIRYDKSPLHVAQNTFGNCYFLAALLAVGSDRLSHHIQANADGSYRVSFGNKSAIILPEDIETITAFNPLSLLTFSLSPNANSDTGLLVPILEAALYKHPGLFGMDERRGGGGRPPDWHSPMDGGDPHDVITFLMGEGFKTYKTEAIKNYLPMLFKSISYNPGIPIVASGASLSFGDGVNHAYAIVGYQDGKVRYKNPWSSYPVFEVSLEDFCEEFPEIVLPNSFVREVFENQNHAVAETMRQFSELL